MNKLISLAIIIAAVIIGGVIYFTQGSLPEALSSQEAAERAISFINESILEGDVTASLVNIEESNGLYKIKFKIEEEEIEAYLSLDGQLLFPQAVEVKSAVEEVQKTDQPDVKLFVMSYCPYGLQAQKALLPAYELLKDKASIGIYFVNYIMHGKEEIDENLNQYCIQNEQGDKYISYLSCFVLDGDSPGCLSSAGIDMSKLSACIDSTDAEFKITEQYNDQSTWLNGTYPKFDVHSSWNELYGVSGSPTLVINDQKFNLASRSPEEFKKAICEAFNTPPEECSQTLSTDVASPGLGGGTGDSSGGSCE